MGRPRIVLPGTTDDFLHIPQLVALDRHVGTQARGEPDAIAEYVVFRVDGEAALVFGQYPAEFVPLEADFYGSVGGRQ